MKKEYILPHIIVVTLSTLPLMQMSLDKSDSEAIEEGGANGDYSLGKSSDWGGSDWGKVNFSE